MKTEQEQGTVAGSAAATVTTADVAEPAVTTTSAAVAEAKVAAVKGVPTMEGRWRKSPRVLERLGLTEEELQSPLDALVKEGIARMYRVREAMRSPLEFTGAIPEELRARSFEYGLAEQANAYRGAGLDRPLWQALSGLYPEAEADMSPEQRERAIRLLLSAVIRLLKFEMQEAEKNKDDWRSYMWDPLPRLCFFLGISRAKLTRYAKEVMGLSAHELVDGIRVLEVRSRMKEALQAFVGFASQEGADGKTEDRAYAIWKRLKESRKTPKWDRQSWAISLGFPNYARMYRACLVLFGKTPGQLEFEVIEELFEQQSKVEGQTSKVGESEVGEVSGVGSDGDKVQFFDGVDEVRRRDAEGVLGVAG